MLRRYFYKTFDSGTRVPTLGSDWYTARIKNPLEENDEVSISLQMWDTPGRERFDARQRRQPKEMIGGSFLHQADAIMLVYDMTSSTSFKQLLKWYADLLEMKEKKPILVVANKLDLFFAEQQRTPFNPKRKDRRDVLGLDASFTGKDFRYEYQVSATEGSHPVKQTKSRMMEISSYLADRENWTTDDSYFASLIISEDKSHPDQDMVKLWCLRNGIKHMDASAATGEGVDEAFRALIELALHAKTHGHNGQPAGSSGPLSTNDPLDLHQRYAPKEERCCHFILHALLQWVRT